MYKIQFGLFLAMMSNYLTAAALKASKSSARLTRAKASFHSADGMDCSCSDWRVEKRRTCDRLRYAVW